MTSPTTADLQRWLDIATEAALSAGGVLRSYWGKLQEVENKGRPGDLVTAADRASEAEVLQILQRHLPTDHNILAEESGAQRRSDSPYTWAIDPLDGTTNYAHQYPFCAVSIGLLVDGKPRLGVVYNPILEELFRAASGSGASFNRLPMQVSTTEHLANSLLVTGFAYDRRETIDNNYAEFCHFTHLSRGVRRGGSAALDLAYVACGRLDGYWERGLSPWDLAAGVVLVEEAGGQVTAYDQSNFDIWSGKILASNGRIHGFMADTLDQVQPLPQFAP